MPGPATSSTTDDSPPRTGAPRRRAAALTPERRRREIIDATVPLLLARGRSITTREIAAAAGVAEGTIFRVFDHKDALIDAVVAAALDPAPFEAALDAIPRTLELHQRLVAAVVLLQDRVASVGELMTAAELTEPPGSADQTRRRASSLAALARLFEPDRDSLRRPPEQCARLLRGVAIALSHPALVVDGVPDASEVVDLVLGGVATGDAPC